MSTHAAPLAISALAYRFARCRAHDPQFSFGTGKFGELADFASAIVFALITLLIAVESGLRLLAPVPIRFGEAMLVAAIGLAVNLVSAWLLSDGHHHQRAHDQHHDDQHLHEHDSNFRAAFLHVLADALTSVLAMVTA
jgi:cation diffusion facilitator family transporter